jgi:hypothetical protein
VDLSQHTNEWELMIPYRVSKNSGAGFGYPNCEMRRFTMFAHTTRCLILGCQSLVMWHAWRRGLGRLMWVETQFSESRFLGLKHEVLFDLGPDWRETKVGSRDDMKLPGF